MPSFTKGGAPKTPFGVNQYLRSTVGNKFESYTVAKDTVPLVNIDGTFQKVLQRGTAMAKITSGPDTGKIGPFQAAGTAEVQTITPTAVTGGSFTITITNPVTGVTRTTPAIAWNATQAAVLAALVNLDNVEPGDIAIGGAATVNAGAITLTFYGNFIGNPAQIVLDTTLIVGTSLVASTTTAGVAGALDGRQLTANLVGICDTFLPWQLLEHDEQVAVLYIGTVVQGWCFELNTAGVAIALQNATVDAMRSVKGMDITAK